MAREAKVYFTSGVGVAQYPHLNKPDYGNENYPDPAGSWKTKLIVDAEDKNTQKQLAQAAEMQDALYASTVERLEEQLVELKTKGGKFKKKADDKAKQLETIIKKDLFEEDYDDEGEPNGSILINYKQKYHITPKGKDDFYITPSYFNAYNKQINAKKVPLIRGGSKIVVGGTMSAYYIEASNMVGVSFKLSGVQIVELSQGGATAESLGFGVQEGGFNATEGEYEGMGDEIDTGSSAADSSADEDEDF